MQSVSNNDSSVPYSNLSDSHGSASNDSNGAPSSLGSSHRVSRSRRQTQSDSDDEEILEDDESEAEDEEFIQNIDFTKLVDEKNSEDVMDDGEGEVPVVDVDENTEYEVLIVDDEKLAEFIENNDNNDFFAVRPKRGRPVRLPPVPQEVEAKATIGMIGILQTLHLTLSNSSRPLTGTRRLSEGTKISYGDVYSQLRNFCKLIGDY